jgi:1-acyl-sn-glycerol-3-phosphate acyltransferase
MLEPIAIDRRAGRKAVEQLVTQGKERLATGRWVIIFPEGTRVAPGQSGRYGIGGAVLAAASEYPIVPVAHNAGEFWPRRGFIKRPGTITVIVGPVIETRGKDAEMIREEAKAWIERTSREIGSLR